MSKSQVKHFRPYITSEEIDLILESLELNLPKTKKLKAKFLNFKFKVSQEVIEAAYESSPRKSLEENLGLGVESGESKLNSIHRLNELYLKNPLLLSKEETYEVLARKFSEFPNSLTSEEILLGKKLELELFSMDLGTFTKESKS